MMGRNISHPGDNPLNNFGLNFYCRNGEIKNAEKAIGKGADVNKLVLGYMTPLKEAIYSGKFKMVKLLCENGADLGVDCFGKSPLTTAQESYKTVVENYIDFNTAERLQIVEYLKVKTDKFAGESK